MLEGLPELQELNMYGNKVAEITIPTNPKLLSKLEVLDMGYNDLVFIPEELDQLKSLKTLRLTNNFLSKVPMRVCDMDALKIIDVTSNPITEPPIETCERGICSMKRYWHCIRHEEQSKKKALAEVQRKVHHHQKHQSASSNKKTSYGGFLLNTIKNPLPRKFGTGGSTCSTGTVNTTASLRSSSVEDEKLVSVPPPANESPRAPSAVDVQAGEMTKISASPTLDKARKISSSSSDHDQSLREGVETDKSSLLHDQVTVNDTLKVIFVGMAMVGKTSMIKRLIEGRYADVPTRDERTVGVDIYDWEPKNDKRFEHIDSRILFQDEKLAQACCDVDVKFSVWDFAGQHVYHATHELFFSCRALYVLVWDMGATNSATIRQKTTAMDNDGETGAFKLTYDSSDEEHEDNNSNDDKDLATEEECKRADRALQHDIDEKVQFWVDCIQSVCPGSAILPVASFDDAFHGSKWGGEAEAKRRCSMLKERLLQHEERSINGIQKRLQEFVDQNRADDIAAKRLRNLTCPYTRPKLIFGDDDDPVVRVSCSDYTGFDRLTEKIIGIATGSIKASRKYPIFHGHIGARIPRMRLEVREAVRRMRGKFKVVEWGYFINVLRDQGLTNVEDISEALHFLTNTGELSYFGGVMAGSQDSSLQNFKSSIDDHRKSHKSGDCCDIDGEVGEHVDEGDDDDVDDDDENAMLSMDDTSITAQSTADGSLSTVEDFMSTGLSQFIFLNPRWLVAAVACILRHDLDREIKETRRVAASGGNPSFTRTASFYDAHLNCPVITAEDACLLWQYKRITKKAADRAQEYSNNMTVTPFEFLQMLLIRFGVFVPIDLSIDKALFGGKEYHQLVEESMNRDVLTESHSSSAPFILNPEENVKKAEFFFLPSLLGPNEPSEAWSYKTTDSWKTTLCHSILFPDGVPPGLTERLTAAVLSSIYAVSRRGDEGLGFNATRQELATVEGQLRVKEVFCWRTAFYVKLGTSIPQPDGSPKESCVEIFTHLAGKDSRLCVGSDYMAVGSRQIITCGRGQVGDGGRKIWKGGYLLVVKCIHRVMEAYTGLEYEKHGYCPECLAKKAVSEASSWDFPKIRAAVLNADETLRCHYGHRVDTRLIAGPYGNFQKPRKSVVGAGEVASVSVQDVLGAVVVVGLWDGKTRKIVRAGSGFIVDKKRGLIVTAAHTLINIWGDKNYPYGEDYYGLSQGRVVIGVIPLDKVGAGGDGGAESGSKVDIASMPAVFRYFAQIVAKDQSLDRGECHLDACVLRITTRMENDVGVDGDGCGDEPEILLLNDHRALKNEPLPKLKMTEKCELEEPVRLIGYNQGGGGVVLPGERLNRYADLAKGYVCMFFVHEEDYGKVRREKFKPREEIVVMCPNIGGHSGGPCINQQGEVIGILSRADPAEHQRCYLVPTKQLKVLVNRAKKIL
jgi:GTPase SAR1 family protein